MSEPYTDERLPGGLRTGQQYLDAIAKDGRRIFVDGEEVADVTAHPAFAETARTMASLFDISSDPANRDLMTYTSPKTGKPVNRIWQLPTSDDLHQRRGAIQRWAEESFGFMGRTPDHVAGFFAGYAAAQVLAPRRQRKFADNAVKIYEFLRDNDVYIAYTIVPPQIDRSKPAHQQNPPDLYAGVVEERDDGVIIKGAQMLGTGAVFADYIHLSSIHPLRPGDENHAISLIVPANAHGVKIHSRLSVGAASRHFRLPTGVAIRRDRRTSRLRQRIRAVGAYLRLQGYRALPRSMVRDACAYPRQQPGTNSFCYETEVPDGPCQAHHRDEWSVADPARARFDRGDRSSVRNVRRAARGANCQRQAKRQRHLHSRRANALRGDGPAVENLSGTAEYDPRLGRWRYDSATVQRCRFRKSGDW